MPKPFQRVIAFDFGTKRLGVALGQALTGHARPLLTLPVTHGAMPWDRIASLMIEWQPDALVVGLPLNMDGTDSELSLRAAKFSRQLHGRFGHLVFLQDERLTTFEARYLSKPQDVSKQVNKVDALAAAVILEAWFASMHEKKSADLTVVHSNIKPSEGGAIPS